MVPLRRPVRQAWEVGGLNRPKRGVEQRLDGRRNRRRRRGSALVNFHASRFPCRMWIIFLAPHPPCGQNVALGWVVGSLTDGNGRMSVFLLALGAVTAAAGMALVVSGVSIQKHVFDTAVLTPGVVALVGGFFLIGLGLAVRVLQQIETTLAARPTSRSVARPAEAAASEPVVDAAPRKRSAQSD